MIKLSMSKIFKVIFFLLVFKTYAFANNFLFDQNEQIIYRNNK